LLGGLALYLNSDSFRQKVHDRVVAELEHMTGGKVEIESFSWQLSTLQFEIRNLTIHGREAAGEVPYAHADRVVVGVKIVSFFARKISLEKVDINHAIFHLIVYPDGSTNQPSPQPGQGGEEQSVSGGASPEFPIAEQRDGDQVIQARNRAISTGRQRYAAQLYQP
jgi:translocation and assembly module TamB